MPSKTLRVVLAQRLRFRAKYDAKGFTPRQLSPLDNSTGADYLRPMISP
jgi:hypothetical protein